MSLFKILSQKTPKNIIYGFLNRLMLTWHTHKWRISPAMFMANPENVKIDRPIFLLGVQGGGLTLLSRMLRQHPQLVSVTGNSSYWAGPDEMQNVMGSFLPRELTGIKNNIPHPSKYPERGWLYAIDDLLPLYRQTTANINPINKTKFEKAIKIALYPYKDTQPRFIDKSQSFTIRLGLVYEILKEKNPFFILVTRNPYAMCYRAVLKNRSYQKIDYSMKDKLDLAIQHWKNTYLCALKDQEQIKNFKIVRFEDILSNPKEKLLSICNFLELDFMETMIPSPKTKIPFGSTGSSSGDSKWYPLRPNPNEIYLRGIDQKKVDQIHQQLGILAERWGYYPPHS